MCWVMGVKGIEKRHLCTQLVYTHTRIHTIYKEGNFYSWTRAEELHCKDRIWAAFTECAGFRQEELWPMFGESCILQLGLEMEWIKENNSRCHFWKCTLRNNHGEPWWPGKSFRIFLVGSKMLAHISEQENASLQVCFRNSIAHSCLVCKMKRECGQLGKWLYDQCYNYYYC